MKKFVFIFHGMWAEPTQEVMDAWTNWFASISDHLVDSGNPLGEAREVTPTGARDLAADMERASGYTIVNAESMDHAVKLLDDCPIITSVRVYEAVSM